MNFSSTERWGAGFLMKRGIIDNIESSFRYTGMTIGELREYSQFVLSIKASEEPFEDSVPMLRMFNIQNGKIDFSELKYIKKSETFTNNEQRKYLLDEGDFLVTRTNGSKDLIGKAAVFHSSDTYTFASYLIRYKLNTLKVIPEYVNIMFMTPIVRAQISVLRRQGGGQYNLNSDEIDSIKIPVPSINIQEEIVKKYADGSKEILKLQNKIEQLRNDGKVYIEKQLFD